jgi:hypothetical protein
MYRVPQLFHVLGAEVLRNAHACSAGHPHKERHYHIDQRPRRTHRRKGVTAYITPHHHRVYRVVRLLQQGSQKQRYRKEHQLLPNRPLGHIAALQGFITPSTFF